MSFYQRWISSEIVLLFVLLLFSLNKILKPSNLYHFAFIFSPFFLEFEKHFFALYQPRLLIFRNENNLEMISMSIMLLMAVTVTTFLSKTVFFSIIFKNITKNFCNDPKAEKKIFQMNGDRLTIKDSRSSILKNLLQHRFFRIYSFVILVNPT